MLRVAAPLGPGTGDHHREVEGDRSLLDLSERAPARSLDASEDRHGRLNAVEKT
jgi:hypothetical protein